jgi:exopolyphosphatase/guanosine-5'-triphosphate,3'-diphosphate pyrophosphatase
MWMSGFEQFFQDSMFSGLGVSQKYDKINQLIAVATNLCHRYNLDLNHAKHVAQLSQKFFENLKGPLGLKDGDLIYLLLAAYLHDIGIFINNRSHHKHTEYIISSLNLFRLTDDEVKVIACVARYHRQAMPNKTHLLYSSLPREQRILVQKLSAILRLANAMDSAHRQKTKDVEFIFSPEGDVTVVAHTSSSFLLEQIDFSEKKNLFEEITGNKIRLTVKE